MPPPEPGMLRTFVALPIGAAARDGLARELARLARIDPSLRVVRGENLHVTVAFLGPTPADDVPRICEALEDAAAGTGEIPVRYEGLGAFPSAAGPRVVWAGVVETGTTSRLASLASRVAERIAALGYRLDARPFHPHVTLARSESRPAAGSVEALRKALTRGCLQDTNMAEVLSDLQLMVSESVVSEQGGGGTRYRPLFSTPLAPEPGPETRP